MPPDGAVAPRVPIERSSTRSILTLVALGRSQRNQGARRRTSPEATSPGEASQLWFNPSDPSGIGTSRARGSGRSVRRVVPALDVEGKILIDSGGVPVPPSSEAQGVVADLMMAVGRASGPDARRGSTSSNGTTELVAAHDNCPRATGREVASPDLCE